MMDDKTWRRKAIKDWTALQLFSGMVVCLCLGLSLWHDVVFFKVLFGFMAGMLLFQIVSISESKSHIRFTGGLFVFIDTLIKVNKDTQQTAVELHTALINERCKKVKKTKKKKK